MRKYILVVLFLIISATPAFAEDAKKEPEYDGKKLSEWIGQLKHGDDTERSAAAYALGEIGGKSAVPALIPFLMNKDYEYDEDIYKSLLTFGKTATPYLLEYLKKSENVLMKEAIVRLLGEIKDQRALFDLAVCLFDPERIIKVGAIEALANFDNKDIALIMVVLINDEKDSNVKDHAALALIKIGNKNIIPRLKDYFHSGNDKIKLFAFFIMRKLDIGSVESLIPIAIKSKDECIRLEVAQALLEMREKTDMSLLLKILDDESPGVRNIVAEALAYKKYKGIDEILIKKLSDKDDSVQAKVAWALGYRDVGKSIPFLIELLGSPNEKLTEAVEYSLRTLSKQNFGADKAKWREWWEANKESILKAEAEKEKAEAENE